MDKIKTHIICKLAALVLIGAFLLPATSKFIHIFEHEEHFAASDSDSNFYEYELNCAFKKTDLLHYYQIYQSYRIHLEANSNFDIPSLSYNFYNKNRYLSFSLRGPPYLL